MKKFLKFEVLMPFNVFTLFNDAILLKLQSSISLCSRSDPNLKLSQNHSLNFIDF